MHGSRLLPEPRSNLPQAVPPLDPGPLVHFRLEAVNAEGRPVSTVNQGETFFLNVYAADLRTTGVGIFSAYLDVAFNQALLTAAGPIQFGGSFPNVRASNVATPGLLDEVGGVGAATAAAVSERWLLQIPLTAMAAGNVDHSSQSRRHSAGGTSDAVRCRRPHPDEQDRIRRSQRDHRSRGQRW